MIFDVTIPDRNQPGQASTFQVDARNWQLALQTGLQKEGTTLHLERAHVVVGDSRVQVSDPGTRRTFVVERATGVRGRQEEILRSVSGSHPIVGRPASGATPALAGDDGTASRPQAGRLEASGTGSVSFKDRNTGSFRAIGAAPSAPRAPAEEATGRILAETRAATGPLDIEAARAHALAAEGPQPSQPVAAASSALEDVFLDIMTIFEPGYGLEDAIDFVLDLARTHVDCAHGVLLFANDDASSLYAATAFGPKKQVFLEHDLSIDSGAPALAMREGFTVSVSDPALDGRHTPELASRIGIDVTSVVAAPVQFEGRAFGALVLVNRNGGSFPPEEANILSYIGEQMGKFIQLQLDATPL